MPGALWAHWAATIRLPPELRDMIYPYLLVQERIPSHVYHSMVFVVGATFMCELIDTAGNLWI
jgi:hypothetical protein